MLVPSLASRASAIEQAARGSGHVRIVVDELHSGWLAIAIRWAVNRRATYRKVRLDDLARPNIGRRVLLGRGLGHFALTLAQWLLLDYFPRFRGVAP